MKKKILSSLLVLTMLCSLIVVPTTVNAGYYSYMPMNFRAYIDYSSYTPEFHFDAYNNTYEIITGFETDLVLFNYSGNIITNWSGSSTLTLTENNIYIDHYESYSGWSSLEEYPGVASASVTLTKVYFADGTTWTNPNNGWLYEEANFYISNVQAADGSYVINDAHEVHLVETGYGMSKRDWYIWNDGAGWVWFSDDIDPTCTVWSAGASIKLVINNDESKYKIISFNVTPEPSFNLKYRNSTKILSTSTSNTGTFYTGYYDAAPYNIDLWDVNNFYGSRSWYLWNDSYGWMLFSYDRGPACQLWSKGEHSIALVYNNDWNTATIYDFSVR